jgi:1-acyl-sn-glycerol-3-phosphate acyltransferase
MGRLLSRLFFWLAGWHVNPDRPPAFERSVMLAAPHTSNWDLPFALAAFRIMQVPVRFTIKKEWLRFPFGLLIKPLGAIGIDRSPKQPGSPRRSMVEAMTELFQTNSGPLVVLVTPEGTRSLQHQWKTGFYYTALQAGVPITCGYLDYRKKEAGIGLLLQPSGDMDADLQQIMAFYSDKTGKFPAQFSLDTRYLPTRET